MSETTPSPAFLEGLQEGMVLAAIYALEHPEETQEEEPEEKRRRIK